MRKISSLILFLVTVITTLNAQQVNQKYLAYIEEFAKFAVETQEKYGIPASITLAQGLLESAAGQSELATECKNHFGIKCGSSWYGKSMKKDDDAVGECFRCYSSARESYRDHAEFLKRQRYAFLYDYPIEDYKSWARGLKIAGYATDPNYPTKLINLIELYDLNKYVTGDGITDKKKEKKHKKDEEPEQTRLEVKPGDKHELFGYVEIKNNRVRCLKLLNDDTFKNIAKNHNISLKKLLYYNDLPRDVQLYRGDYVYLSPKRNSTAKNIPVYTVRAGDSMHSIAQEYGIKLKALYKLNNLEYGTEAKVGQKLKLHR